MSVIDNCKMLFTSGALLVLSGAFAAESGVPAVEDPVIPPAAVYDNGGLFAEFDARENAGAGMHDDTARSWVNLKSDEFPAVWMLDNESPAWSETGVTFAYNTFQRFEVAGDFMAAFGDHWTVQALVTIGSDYGKNYSGICGNHGNNDKLGVNFGQCENSSVWFKVWKQSEGCGVSVPASEFAVGSTYLLTMTMSSFGIHVYTNAGERARLSSISHGPRMSLSPFFIGRAHKNQDRSFSGTIHALRVYTNELDAAAVAKTWSYDAVRYCGVTPRTLTVSQAKKDAEFLEVTLGRPITGERSRIGFISGHEYHGADLQAWVRDGGEERLVSGFAAESDEQKVVIRIPEEARFVRFTSDGLYSPTLDLEQVPEGEIELDAPELGSVVVGERALTHVPVSVDILSAGSASFSCSLYSVLSHNDLSPVTNVLDSAAATGERSYEVFVPNVSAGYRLEILAVNKVADRGVKAGPFDVPAVKEPLVGRDFVLCCCPTNGLFACYDSMTLQNAADASTWANIANGGLYPAKLYKSSGAGDPVCDDRGVRLVRAGTMRYQVDSTDFEREFTAGGAWTVQASVTPTSSAYVNYAGMCGGHGGSDGLSFGQHQDTGFYFTANGLGVTMPKGLLPADRRMAITVTANADGVACYTNGALYASAAKTANWSPVFGVPKKFCIGAALADRDDRCWDGGIDYVRVYTNAFDAADVKEAYAADQARLALGSLLQINKLVYTGRGFRAKVGLSAAVGDALDLYLVCGSAPVGISDAWDERFVVGRFAAGSTGPVAVDVDVASKNVRYLRFVAVRSGAASLATDGAWSPTYYVPDIPYGPKQGLMLILR